VNPRGRAARYTAEMRRLARPLGTTLIVAGVLGLAWVVVVWRWQDPVTGLYTQWKQHQLARSIARRFAAYPTYSAGRLDRSIRSPMRAITIRPIAWPRFASRWKRAAFAAIA
jgi:hypothetical protein